MEPNLKASQELIQRFFTEHPEHKDGVIRAIYGRRPLDDETGINRNLILFFSFYGRDDGMVDVEASNPRFVFRR